MELAPSTDRTQIRYRSTHYGPGTVRSVLHVLFDLTLKTILFSFHFRDVETVPEFSSLAPGHKLAPLGDRTKVQSLPETVLSAAALLLSGLLICRM